MDIDGDGVISLDEVRESMPGDHTDESVYRALKEVDMTNSNTITRAEFNHMMNNSVSLEVFDKRLSTRYGKSFKLSADDVSPPRPLGALTESGGSSGCWESSKRSTTTAGCSTESTRGEAGDESAICADGEPLPEPRSSSTERTVQLQAVANCSPPCMCCDPRAPATQELSELSTGIPYCSACSPSRLVLSDHMQNSELY